MKEMKFSVHVRFDPHDMWVGIFWLVIDSIEGWRVLNIYVCILPMLPIHFAFAF